MSHKKPGSLRCRCCLEVFGETAASAEPSKCALNNPSPGQKLEALDALGPLDDLDGPWTTV